MILLNKFINFIGQDHIYDNISIDASMKNYNTIILRGYRPCTGETFYMYKNKKIWIDHIGMWKIVGKTFLAIDNRYFIKRYELRGDIKQYDFLRKINALSPFYKNYDSDVIYIALYMKESF